MKEYSIFPKPLGLEPHYQMQFRVIPRTLVLERCYSSAVIQSVYSTVPVLFNQHYAFLPNYFPNPVNNSYNNISEISTDIMFSCSELVLLYQMKFSFIPRTATFLGGGEVLLLCRGYSVRILSLVSRVIHHPKFSYCFSFSSSFPTLSLQLGIKHLPLLPPLFNTKNNNVPPSKLTGCHFSG